jgi:hypothetical protein
MPQHTINDAHKAAAAEHSVTVIPAGAAFEKFESQSLCMESLSEHQTANTRGEPVSSQCLHITDSVAD